MSSPDPGHSGGIRGVAPARTRLRRASLAGAQPGGSIRAAIAGRAGAGLAGQRRRHRGLILGAAVLAQLVLRLHGVDGQFHPHDPAQLAVDVVRRGVGDGPGRVTVVLVPPGQPGHHVTQPLRVPVHGQRPREVNGDVIPGGHHPPVPGRARVPRRGDVGLRAVHDGQRTGSGSHGLPLRVGQGEMAEQPAVLAGAGVPDDRDEAGDGLDPVERDQIGSGGGGHERGNVGRLRRGEVGREIHATSVRIRPRR